MEANSIANAIKCTFNEEQIIKEIKRTQLKTNFLWRNFNNNNKNELLSLHYFYCPLWLITFEATFKRFLLGSYKTVKGVGVDGWFKQVGSIGTIPELHQVEVAKKTVLENHCTKNEAIMKAKEYLDDILTIHYRAVPNLEVRKVFLAHQLIWIAKIIKKNKMSYVTFDGITGRQLHRYDKRIKEIISELNF